MSSLANVEMTAPRTRVRAARGMFSHEHLDEVESVMASLCHNTRLDRLGSIVREHLDTGGKRLRAHLALAATEALGGSRRRAIGWAAACELLHNATLIHDDLQDGDRYRRGTETMWVRYGSAQAINAGDLCLTLPYLAIADVPVTDAVRWQLSSCLARCAVEVVRGQAEEMELLASNRLGWDDYAMSVEGKTAALFALPIYGAALINGFSPEKAEEFADAFRSIGLLFQMQDDILDLYGDKGRDEAGSDLREGKVSALVVEHLRLHPRDRTWLVNILRTPRDETLDSDVREAMRRFRTRGALAAVWQRIGTIEERAFDSNTLVDAPRLDAIACELVARALVPVLHTDPAGLGGVLPHPMTAERTNAALV